MSGGVAKAFQSFSPTGATGSSKRGSEPRSGSRAWALQWDVETCLGVADGAGEQPAHDGGIAANNLPAGLRCELLPALESLVRQLGMAHSQQAPGCHGR